MHPIRRTALILPLLLLPAVLVVPAARADGATVQCSITDQRITESSGLAAAGTSLYTLNDGGSSLQVYKLTSACTVASVVQAPVDPYDVEDLARGADGTLWLADIGDNDHKRRTVAIEKLTEAGKATLYRCTYPDGAHDAETLLLSAAGVPYIVTKEVLGRSGVYTPASALVAGKTAALKKVGEVVFTPTGTKGGPIGAVGQLLATGGAVSPDGRLVAIRTYTDVYVWRAADKDVAAALAGKPTRIALPATAQGEAVTFTPDGTSLLTSTEGSPAPVHRIPLGALAAPSPSAAPSAGAVAPKADEPVGAARTTRAVLAVGVLGVLLLLIGGAFRKRSASPGAP